MSHVLKQKPISLMVIIVSEVVLILNILRDSVSFQWCLNAVWLSLIVSYIEWLNFSVNKKNISFGYFAIQVFVFLSAVLLPRLTILASIILAFELVLLFWGSIMRIKNAGDIDVLTIKADELEIQNYIRQKLLSVHGNRLSRQHTLSHEAYIALYNAIIMCFLVAVYVGRFLIDFLRELGMYNHVKNGVFVIYGVLILFYSFFEFKREYFLKSHMFTLILNITSPIIGFIYFAFMTNDGIRFDKILASIYLITPILISLFRSVRKYES